MGKREIGQLGIIDLIVSILIAELVAISIENTDKTLFITIIPVVLLVLLEILLAYLSIKFRGLRTLFGGRTSLIIYDGKINYKEMVKQRYSLDDLLLSLRQKEIRSIDEVEYAFLEPNGKLSVFKYGIFKLKKAYPMPIIIDGKIQYETLRLIKHSYSWIIDQLRNIDVENIFYAFYKNNKIYIISKKD
jgi:uncharacterized membrane protein YcaP (DUF421 family)